MSRQSKPASGGTNGKRSSRSGNKLIVTIICTLIVGWGIWQFSSMASRYDGDVAVWVKIPRNASKQSATDSLKKALGPQFSKKVISHWDGDPAKSRGAYRIEPGERAFSVARRLNKGQQTPIKLTFNNIRTLAQLSERLTSRMDWGDGEFIRAFAAEAEDAGVTEEMFIGRMMPDTYEVYWTSTPSSVIKKLLSNHTKFWDNERHAKAEALGLTPDQVTVIASIAEEETSKADERGKVARLYINRLHRGMKLQADPTVKFAVGDFSIRRVGGKMLDTDSPYNTYRYAGLPPGPIRIPDRRTIQAVLDAPAHDYIYMCAKSDFSGYHDFTSDYQTHLRNAAAFRNALDRRGITL